MLKFNRMFSSLFIATELVFVVYSYCYASVGDSVSPLRSPQERGQRLEGDRFFFSWQGDNEPEPPKPSVPGGSRATSWQDIFSGEPPKEGETTGTRGGFCPIAPANFRTTQVVWNDRPLFLWDETRGNVTRVEVRDSSDLENPTIVWEAEPTQNQVYYDGEEALEPGRTYDWVVFFNGANLPTMAIPFQIAVAADRDRIAIELAALLAQLPEDADAEDVARTRAQYFAENELTSDALFEAFTVVEPSPELEEILEMLPEEYCREPETDFEETRGGGDARTR